MTVSDMRSRLGLHGDAAPNPAALIDHGAARFTVLTPRLIRLNWAAAGDHDDRPSFAFPQRAAAEAPQISVQRAGEQIRISTGPLTIEYNGPGPFSAENLAIRFQLGGRVQTWHPGMQDYRNLRGARRTLDGCRGEAALEPGLISRAGWSLHDDTSALRFHPQHGWAEPAAPGERQDWYFFGYGHDYPAALAEYARFGGAPPLIPRWVLGPWWSRFWAYSDDDLRTLTDNFAAHDLPLDVLVIDMDWHLPNSWTGYTWNRDLLPDPPALLAWLHQQGLRVTLNLHPAAGVQPFEAAYPAFAEALGLDPQAQQAIPFRISDPRFAEPYFRLLHHPLEQDGVDFWWMDWQQGRSSEMPGLDPLPWLNHLHYVDLQRHADRRPLVFSRWGGLGNHRYPIGFSGDTYATWEALRYQPYFTACAANVLYGWWSHDIGGHFGVTAPELYVRWVQFGALSPILRLHSTKDAAAERLPWAFPAPFAAAAKAAFQLRSALLPYFYTLSREHHEQALAPCRPLYYNWPEAEDAYIAREQYMLGDQMLVAPIVHPADPTSRLAAADIWIPPGSWIARASGELFVGPKWVRITADLQDVPQFVRAGGILPLGELTQRSDAQIGGPRILSIFPGADGALRIYDDGGHPDSPGEWTTVRVRMLDEGRRYQIAIDPVEGRDPALPPTRDLRVRLEHVARPDAVECNGSTCDWQYDPQAPAVVIALPAQPKDAALSITLAAAAPLSLASAEHAAELRAADARRMLATATQSPSELHAAALARADTGVGTDALARLGGPFVRLYTYTTPEDAAQTLGRLLIAAPSAPGPLAVQGTWRMITPGGLRSEAFALEQIARDTIVTCPFAWDGRSEILGWELEIELIWHGHAIRRRLHGPTFFATVGTGAVLTLPSAQAPAPQEVIDAAGAPRPEFPWRIWQRATDHVEFQSLVERDWVPLHPNLSAGDHIGYLALRVQSPAAREVIVAAQAYRPLRLWVNAAPLAIAEQVQSDALTLNEAWSRSVPANLHAGENYILVLCDLRAEDGDWRAFLHVMLLDPEGRPAADLAILTPEADHSEASD